MKASILPLLTHMGLLSGPHMGPLLAAHMGLSVWDPYGPAYMRKPIYIPHLAHMCLISGPNMGPSLACLYARFGIGPIWVLYGCANKAWPYGTITHGAHIGLLSGPHMGPLWAAHIGLAVWDPYVFYKGVPIWASPYTSQTGPIWDCYMGPTSVHYGRAHMGLSVWDP